MQAKATLNPFKHITNGFKKIAKTNMSQIIGFYLITAVVIYAISTLSALFIFSNLNKKLTSLTDATTASGIKHDLVFLVASLVVFGLILSIVSSILGLTQIRLLLNGLRSKKGMIGEAFKLATERFWLLFALLLILIGVFIVAGVLGAFLPPLLILFVLVFFVASIMYFPTLLLLGFTAVDDVKPAGPIALFKQSRQTAKKVTGATWVMLITYAIISIIIGAVLGAKTFSYSVSTSTSPTTSFTQEGNTLDQQTVTPTQQFNTSDLKSPKTILSNIVGILVGGLFTFGIGELYELATESTPLPPASAPVAAAAPPSPVPPVVPPVATPPATPQV